MSLEHVGWDVQHARWRNPKLGLPINPCWSPAKTPVLLVPERFLSELPSADDTVFWDWVYVSHGAQLRVDVGQQFNKKIEKKGMLRLAAQRAWLRQKYGREYADYLKQKPPGSYDFIRDRRLLVTPLDTALQLRDGLSLTPPTDEAEMCKFVRELCDQVKSLIERKRFTRSFWHGDTKRCELDVQEIFHFAIALIAKEASIDITPEAETGVGPVDFKFVASAASRVLVELKFARSSSYWANMKSQLPAYLDAEDIDCGVVVVLQHGDDECTPAFVQRTRKVVLDAATASGRDYRVVFIDVRKKPSASRIRASKRPGRVWARQDDWCRRYGARAKKNNALIFRTSPVGASGTQSCTFTRRDTGRSEELGVSHLVPLLRVDGPTRCSLGRSKVWGRDLRSWGLTRANAPPSEGVSCSVSSHRPARPSRCPLWPVRGPRGHRAPQPAQPAGNQR